MLENKEDLYKQKYFLLIENLKLSIDYWKGAEKRHPEDSFYKGTLAALYALDDVFAFKDKDYPKYINFSIFEKEENKNG